jgi:hypothetical protein
MRFDIDFSLIDFWLQNSMSQDCHIVMTLSILSAGSILIRSSPEIRPRLGTIIGCRDGFVDWAAKLSDHEKSYPFGRQSQRCGL